LPKIVLAKKKPTKETSLGISPARKIEFGKGRESIRKMEGQEEEAKRENSLKTRICAKFWEESLRQAE